MTADPAPDYLAGVEHEVMGRRYKIRIRPSDLFVANLLWRSWEVTLTDLTMPDVLGVDAVATINCHTREEAEHAVRVLENMLLSGTIR